MASKKVKGPRINILTIVLLAIAIFFTWNYFNKQKPTQDLTYNEFETLINSEDTNINEIEVTLTKNRESMQIYGKYNDAVEVEVNGKKQTFEEFVIEMPYSDTTEALIQSSAIDNDFEVTYAREKDSIFLSLISILFLPLVFVGVFIFFMSRQSGAGGAMEFGKSKAKLHTDSKKIRYKDVAGLDEEKQELIEIVDFLKSPKKFTDMGARIPKGVLLVGPPGTGKTLLAKSVAGEAQVPFYFISGSDFLEMFVGVGASRVRDMFKKAKESAPCVIFIDEIDAVGRQRGAGLGGGNDEREQTLNQILVEMDGFEGNEGIIILAATNRADVLDPALLRPGRFDRQVMVNLPTVEGRREILELHAANKKFDADVDFKAIAERTPGYSGADLENTLNEAALLAVRENLQKIPMELIDEAIDRVLMGPAKRSKKYSQHEKSLVAHHEAGHVVAGLLIGDAQEVHKVTIIPRGMAGGYAMMLPKEDRYFTTRAELIDRINGLLAGRVAEVLIFNEISTGAHNDFEQATKIARAMVTEYGMSDLGPVQWEQKSSAVFLGRDYNDNKNFSDSVAHEIDVEVRKIIAEAYDKTVQVLTENLDLLKAIAAALMEKETLTKADINTIYQEICLGIKPAQPVDPELLDELLKQDKIKNEDSEEKA